MRRRAFLVLLTAGTVVACRRRGALEPPEIRYGRDVCAECGMIISDPRFAAAAATADGETLIFDDIGDLLSYRAKHSPQWVAIWVHDYENEQWIRAEEAWYVASAAVRTPMDWGLAAFASEEAARRRQGEWGGQVVRWEELVARPLEHPRR